MGKVVVAGANGYIGMRLLYRLIEDGYDVVAIVRSRERLVLKEHLEAKIEVLEADFLIDKMIRGLPKDIDQAFYLVHTQTEKNETNHRELDAAKNFINALKDTAIKQAVFFTELTDQRELKELLIESTLSYTLLRASMIIGSGSYSFEIIRDLVEKFPLMVAPQWLNSKTSPIAIFDVIYFLSRVIKEEKFINKSFDITGSEEITYKELLYTYAKFRKIKRLIITLPWDLARLSSLWISLTTSVNRKVAREEIAHIQAGYFSSDHTINELTNHKCLKLNDALRRTHQKVEHDAVTSSWKDVLIYSKLKPDLHHYVNIPKQGCYQLESTTPFLGNKSHIIDQIFSIGGSSGYYAMNWAWRVRGVIDKCVGGVGLRRGRTRRAVIHCGDVIDWWRVISADATKGKLLLFAEMKSPGEAWLQFEVDGDERLTITATFRPKGLLGRAYWWLLLPIHSYIFRAMGRKIVNNSAKKSEKS